MKQLVKIGNHLVLRGATKEEYEEMLKTSGATEDDIEAIFDYPLEEMEDDTVVDNGCVYVELTDIIDNKEEKQEYREDCYSVGGGFIDGLVSGDGDWAVYLLSAEDNESDPLQDFCNEEAPFRLEEIHNVPKDQITEDMVAEVANIIRDCIDYNEDLYDSIDYDIREYLENNYKKEKNNV